ncbi:type VI secretion system protein TssA [Duganella sp. CY15W]|uniref:type VI secretion system protein TssA n=1 Tax=Duganella sp. CY15W TaxID=2692172 RepID=UPI00136B0D57|nr:type VI secretion system protein TssA [Duganella sp. CY15W]MYM27139.1 type VI secretion system protein TssA [Duganella sp. CY15W]
MLSIEQLLQPVSVGQRCGEDLSFSSDVDEIAQARQYDDPTLDQGEWQTALKEANWPFVATRCATLIATRSKDLRLAVWFAEAQARTHGLRGLGEGYQLLAGLCQQYWDDLYPLADGDDCDQRVGNLFWLLTRTPALVRECASPAVQDAEFCLSALIQLERVVDTQLGVEGPGFTPAKDALQSVIRSLAPHSQFVALVSDDDVIAPVTTLQDRVQALQQLRLIADFFRRTEPHSPVAYLAERAATWGEMPLHVWLRAVIKDPAAIAGVEELLGAAPLPD